VKDQTIHLSAMIYFPLAVLLTSVATFGAGSLLAALNVKYRDFRYIIPFLVQFLLFLSPVIYPQNITSHKYLNLLLALNPMTAPLDFFRCALTGTTPAFQTNLVSIVVSLMLLITGIVYFRKTEAYFADLA